MAAANVDGHNRLLHSEETAILNKLSEGKTAAERYRLIAAACALTKCAAGVPDVDKHLPELKQLQQTGEQFTLEKDQLLASGAFRYTNFDRANDARNKYDRAVTKTTGLINLGAGVLIILYHSTGCLCCCGACMKNLSHSAAFHSGNG